MGHLKPRFGLKEPRPCWSPHACAHTHTRVHTHTHPFSNVLASADKPLALGLKQLMSLKRITRWALGL